MSIHIIIICTDELSIAKQLINCSTEEKRESLLRICNKVAFLFLRTKWEIVRLVKPLYDGVRILNLFKNDLRVKF